MVLFSLITAAILLTAALYLALGRLLVGPTLADRVVAMDLSGLIIAGLIAIWCVMIDNPMFLDVVLVIAVVAFFGTLIFAHYLEKRSFE